MWDLVSGVSRVVHRDRSLMRMRLVNEGRTLVFSRRNAQIAAIHNLNLSADEQEEAPNTLFDASMVDDFFESAATLQSVFHSEALREIVDWSETLRVPTWCASWFALPFRLASSTHYLLATCSLTRKENQVEFLHDSSCSNAYSLELSASARFLLSRGIHVIPVVLVR